MRIARKNLIFILLAFVLILVAGLRPLEHFRDTSNYLKIIHSDDGLFAAEPTLWIINQVNKLLLGGVDQVFFLLYAFLGVSLTMLAIMRLSPMPWLSVIVYLCLFFVLHEMTQIRAGVAVAFFLLAIPDIANRNLKSYLIKTALAISFHYSAIVMILLYFISPSKKRILTYWFLPIIGFLVATTMPSGVLNFLEYIAVYFPRAISSKITIYLALYNSGAYETLNIFNLYILSLIFIYYFSLFCISRFNNSLSVILVKLLGIQIFVYYFFSILPVFSLRISEFISVSLIFYFPNFVLLFKQKLLPSLFVLTLSIAFFNIFSLSIINF